MSDQECGMWYHIIKPSLGFEITFFINPNNFLLLIMCKKNVVILEYTYYA